MPDPNATPTALELATTEELFEQLARRSEAAICAYVLKAGNKMVYVRYAGHMVACLGLQQVLGTDLRRACNKRS